MIFFYQRTVLAQKMFVHVLVFVLVNIVCNFSPEDVQLKLILTILKMFAWSVLYFKITEY